MGHIINRQMSISGRSLKTKIVSVILKERYMILLSETFYIAFDHDYECK